MLLVVGLCPLASLPPHWNPTEISRYRLTGRRYEDLVNILGVSAAGFVPQLFSNRYDNLDVLFELLATSGAKALVIEPDLFLESDYPVPYLLALSEKQVSIYSCAGLRLGEIPSCAATDCGYIVHSSGTTKGKPRPIPLTHRWIKTFVEHKWPVRRVISTY